MTSDVITGITLIVAIPIIFTIFYIPYLIFHHKLNPISRIAKGNHAGQASLKESWKHYSKDKDEAETHMKKHQDMMEHYDGESFYCNTFTGWRAKRYDRIYNKAEARVQRAVPSREGQQTLRRRAVENQREYVQEVLLKQSPKRRR